MLEILSTVLELESQHRYIKDSYQKGLFQLKYISTYDRLADSLTKTIETHQASSSNQASGLQALLKTYNSI